MKVRQGFVSNSSSTSFLCDVCGAIESGWDTSASDVGMSTCQNDHTFCTDHVTEPSIEKKKQMLLSNPEFAVKVQEGDEEDIEDLYDEYVSECDGVPGSECPFCSFDRVEDKYLLPYMLKRLGYSSKEDLVAFLRKEYGTYEDFVSSTKECTNSDT